VSSWSRSRTISRLAASCSEVAPAIAWDMPLEDGVRDLPPELLEQLVETLSCLWFEEVVVLEGPDPIADIVRQGIESLLAPGGQVRGELAQLGRVAGAAREPSLDAPALGRHDRLELGSDIAQDVVQVVPLEGLSASLRETLPEGVEPAERVAHPVGTPWKTPTHQAHECLEDVALLHQVVGDGPQDLVRGEVGQPLGSVPARVADLDTVIAGPELGTGSVVSRQTQCHGGRPRRGTGRPWRPDPC